MGIQHERTPALLSAQDADHTWTVLVVPGMPVEEWRRFEPGRIDIEYVHLETEVAEHSSNLVLNRRFLSDGARNPNEILEQPDARCFEALEGVMDGRFRADRAHW
jgi:hypothetical protein